METSQNKVVKLVWNSTWLEKIIRCWASRKDERFKLCSDRTWEYCPAHNSVYVINGPGGELRRTKWVFMLRFLDGHSARQSLLSIHIMAFGIHLYFWRLLRLLSVLMHNLSVCQFYSIIPSKKSETAFSINKSRIFKHLNFTTFSEELTHQLLLHAGDFSYITGWRGISRQSSLSTPITCLP